MYCFLKMNIILHIDQILTCCNDFQCDWTYFQPLSSLFWLLSISYAYSGIISHYNIVVLQVNIIVVLQVNIIVVLQVNIIVVLQVNIK